VLEAIRASSIHLSITSTSTVRHGGLSTSTTKSQNEIMHRILHPSAFEEFLIDVRRRLLIGLAIGEASPEFQRLIFLTFDREDRRAVEVRFAGHGCPSVRLVPGGIEQDRLFDHTRFWGSKESDRQTARGVQGLVWAFSRSAIA